MDSTPPSSFAKATADAGTPPSILGPEQAIYRVRSWLDRPVVQIAEPGPRHLDIFGSLLRAFGVAGNLTTDAHVAAIAIEHQYELHSNDSDFASFPGPRWRNPL